MCSEAEQQQQLCVGSSAPEGLCTKPRFLAVRALSRTRIQSEVSVPLWCSLKRPATSFAAAQ